MSNQKMELGSPAIGGIPYIQEWSTRAAESYWAATSLGHGCRPVKSLRVDRIGLLPSLSAPVTFIRTMFRPSPSLPFVPPV